MLISSVHFLFIVFMVMLSLVMVLVMVVLIYNFVEYKQSARTTTWSGIINQKISDAIVYDKDEMPVNPQFNILALRKPFRNLFLQRLVDSEKKFSGAAKNKIRDLFKEYSLRDVAMDKLSQKKLHLIAQGIGELAVMDQKEAVPKISLFLSHPSYQVYLEAQYAMVRLKGFEGLYFLDILSAKISEWQQLRLLLSISSLPPDADFAIGKWLESTNDSVVIFTLKLIKKFQLLSFYSKIKELLSTSSVEIRIKAIQTLMSLENPETVAYLSTIYNEQPDDVRVEILRVIKWSKDHCCTDLLKKELFEGNTSGIKVNAAQALYELGYSGYLSELSGQEELSEELIQIVKYALQEKVC
ncbi:hypothetical protein SAMN05443633_12237 [Chryseobacterium arachidis]|uniref:HEAT repeat-containing protein n=1 Tax=Chryseobacterium arachidis TaxID=1416778 RepID=A0A1M5MIX1_9FLAO|nr:HEAT repeat domain-containing protein [Chryseobacterium arachidis]SHG77151.1 hypothetical protein SAMN05443633_12237 [Chryseobacterium arachidis]